MPADYFTDTVRPQLCSLLQETVLQDTTIMLRASSVSVSSFVMSLTSPILRKMVCGDFKESICKRISLDDVEEGAFSKLLRIACGEDGVAADDVEELLDVAILAERLQMNAVREHLEDVLLKKVVKDTCVDWLQASEANGLERFRASCYKLLRDEFETVSHHESFHRLSEETIGDLLDEDELEAEREEDVFKALVRWLSGKGEGVRGEGMLRKIRYGVMGDRYLARKTLSALPGHQMLQNLVWEAMAKKGAEAVEGQWDGVERLCCKWTVARTMKPRVIGAGVLQHPACVAIDLQGRILVSDHRLHQIVVFNKDGSLVRAMGSQGRAEGQFIQPTGVAVDSKGRVVVADSFNHRIQVLKADGTFACCFGTEGWSVGKFIFPQGVAIDRKGHIFVSDQDHRIQMFDSRGTLLQHFGSLGASKGQLNCPMGLAVDGAGRILVADTENHRVQVFNADGSFLLHLGSEGTRPGRFKNPRGVAVDKRGRIVVSDKDNHRVQVFNADRSVARVIDSAAAGRNGGVVHLRYPFGVAVGRAGRIVVVEAYAGGRVVVI